MGHLTANPVVDTTGDRTMVLNMGPQHPSTHGVLRLLLEIDGEIIVRMVPDIGFLHTGIEKTCEAKFYQQVVPLTDRIDYLCPMVNNLCYVLAVEKLLGMEIPPRAVWMRVLLTELQRISSHLVWLGTHAMDIGAMSVFLYCFREREDLLRIYEMVSGQRMMTSYFRIGGLAMEPPIGFFAAVKKFVDVFPERVDEYENLLTGNRIFIDRLKNVAKISKEDALALGVTGPSLRASGVDGIFVATCRTAGMRTSNSRSRLLPMATSGRVTSAACRNSANLRRSADRRLKECLRDQSKLRRPK